MCCLSRYYFPSHIFSFPNWAPQGIWIRKQASSFSLVGNIIRNHWQQWRQPSNSLHPPEPNKTGVWQYLLEVKTWVRYTNSLRDLRLGVLAYLLLGFFLLLGFGVFLLFKVSGSSRSTAELHKHFQETACSLAQKEPALPTGCSSTRSLCNWGISVLIPLEGKNYCHQRFFLN